MLIDADIAGNAYWVRIGNELVRLRPDWTDIILAPRVGVASGKRRQIGYSKVGYVYYEGGRQAESQERPPAIFLPDQVVHFAPIPDPLGNYRGMSWITPVIREIQADQQAVRHKQAFWDNAATPNLAVSLKLEDPELFDRFVETMERQHTGAANAYKTLYTAAGADVSVIGKDMAQTDFSNVVGKGETRIALLSGIHPVVAGLSEGMQGSSLNAGNYAAAKRATADKTFRPLWRNAAGSLQLLFPAPPGARLWYDTRDVAFLRDDASDLAGIQFSEAQTIRQLVDAGYTPVSVVSAVLANDWSVLSHSGLYSVQLQPPGNNQIGAPNA
jgi:phage portal protein BeeE